MTEKTAEVLRLDYSKPPPGYEVIRLDGEELYRRPGCRLLPLDGPYGAWAFYKKDNDPPGCSELFNCAGLDTDGEQVRGWKFRFGITSDEVLYTTVLLARTAAWAWYDRRLALAAKLDVALIVDEEPLKGRIIRTVVPAGEARHFDGEQRPYAAWPRILTWSDEQVAEVERWLADSTAEMPEVLRG